MKQNPIPTVEYEKSGEERCDKMIIKHVLAKTFLFIGIMAVTAFGGWLQPAMGFGLPRGGLAEEGHYLQADGHKMVKITLSNMRDFEVINTGDNHHSPGELRYIEIYLHGPNNEFSFQKAKGGSAFRITRRSGRRVNYSGRSSYIKIHWHDQFRITNWNGRRDRNNSDSLWINARPGARFSVAVKSRELDCSGHRKCNRHNDGHYNITMTLPALPENLPRSCGPSNTYPLRNVDMQPLFTGLMDVSRSNINTKLAIIPLSGQICVTAVSGFSSAATLRPVRRPTQRAGSLPVRVDSPGSD